jgi:hypothetical protein
MLAQEFCQAGIVRIGQVFSQQAVKRGFQSPARHLKTVRRKP